MKVPDWRIGEILTELMAEGAMDGLPPILQEYVERAAERFEEKGRISPWDYFPMMKAYETISLRKKKNQWH